MKHFWISLMVVLGFQMAQAAYFPAVEDQQEVNMSMDVAEEAATAEGDLQSLKGGPPFPIPGQCTCYVEDWHRRVYEGSDWNCRRAEDEALRRCQRYSRRCYYLGCERRSPF